MNSVTPRTLKSDKGMLYVILLIVSLLLFFLGSSVILFVVAIPYKTVTGINLTELSEALLLFEKYYSSDKMESGAIYSEYVQAYFSNDPILFDNIKSFYCAVQFLSYMPVLAIILYFLRQDFVDDIKSFKKNTRKNLKAIAIGIVGMYVCSLVVTFIYDILSIEGTSANENIINLLLNSPGRWLMILSVVIFAPIVEEVIFRKLLIDTCEVKFGLKPIYAIIISSIIFAFIHVSDIESLKFIFQYIALAIPICYAYHYSENNIIVPIIVHIINNLMSVIISITIWMR